MNTAITTTNAREAASLLKQLIQSGQTNLSDLRRLGVDDIQKRWFPSIHVAVLFTALQGLLSEGGQ